MTFLAYLTASADRNAAHLAEALSGLADGANDIAVVVAHLRATLGDSEAVLAEREARYQWEMWRRSERRKFKEMWKA